MLTENKFSKYLLYAFGEIILVVIGILIALQIGEWKKENESSQLELKIIREISNNLENDLKQIQGDISIMQVMDTACIELKGTINAKSSPDQNFFKNAGLLRVMPHYDPNKSGYDLLVSKGIEIISNDVLRNEISTHYERLYSYYRRYEDERFMFHINHSESKLIEYLNFDFDLDNEYYWKAFISSNDYKKILVDESFIKLLTAVEMENKQVLSRAVRVEKSIESLLKVITKEIVKMEK